MLSKLCVFGDSISKGVVLDSGADRYQFLKNCFASCFSACTGIIVDNYSKFGCTVKKGLEIVQRNLAKLRDYDFIVLEYGGNDSDFDWSAIASSPDTLHLCRSPMYDFLQTYDKVIDTVRSNGGKPIMMTLPPIDANKYFNYLSRSLNAQNILRWLGDVGAIFRWHEGYNAAICDMAQRKNVHLVDIRTPFLAQSNYSNMLCDDGIHPNAKGHDFICTTLRSMLPA